MAGKRIPHKTDSPRNDVRIFSDQQAEIQSSIKSLAGETRDCKILTEFSTSKEVQKRISSVVKLLQALCKPSEQTKETRAQLNLAFANTPDAAEYSKYFNSYGLLNKMVT